MDIKGPNLIKAVSLEGLRIIGNPQEHAVRYYQQGADEIVYMDSVASLYGRNNLSDIVEKTAENVFVPITVGGGIRSVEDAKKLLRCGADKVAVNTAALNNPTLISELAEVFGSQCVVLSVEAKHKEDSRNWEAYSDNGREKSGVDVLEWCHKAVELGAGEILLTSVDREGTCKGFEDELVAQVANSVTVPVIASGGMGKLEHLHSVIRAGADAVAVADVLHYKKLTMGDLHQSAREAGFHCRKVDEI